MIYFDTVLNDPLFSQLCVGGMVVFGLFGAWRFFYLYVFLIFVTFAQSDVMLYSMIYLVVLLSFHYVAALFSLESKSPLKDVT